VTATDGIQRDSSPHRGEQVLASGADDVHVALRARGLVGLQDVLISGVDDRRTHCRGRPGRVLLPDHRGRAGEVRGRHRGALEERPAGGGGWSRAELGGNRAQHVDAGRDHVRLDPEVHVGGPLAAEPGHDVAVRRAEVRGRRGDGGALPVASDQRGPVREGDHVGCHRRLVGSSVRGHPCRVARHVVDDEHGDGAGVLRVADLGRERAGPARDERNLPSERPRRQRGAGKAQSRSGGDHTQGRGQIDFHWREIGRRRRSENTTADRHGYTDEVRHRAGPGGKSARGGARRLHGEVPGTGVPGGYREHHVRLVEVVHRDRQQILDAVGAAAQAHVADVEAIRVSSLHRVQDVLGAGIAHVTGKDVVVAEQRPGGDAGYLVGDGDAAHGGGRLEVAGDGAGDVRAVVLDRFRGIAVRGRLVVEHLGRDHLVVGEIAVAELVLGRVARILEAGVRHVDAGIDDGHFDPGSRRRRAAAASPGRDGVDEPEVGIIGRRVVEALVFGALHHRGGGDRLQLLAIQAQRHRVQRDVELAGHLRRGGLGPQPGFEVVSQGREIGAV